PAHPHGVPAAVRASGAPRVGPEPRAAPRTRVGLRLLRRRPPRRRAHPSAADEDRGRPGRAGDRRDGPGPRVPLRRMTDTGARRWGLRIRVTVAFALIALVIVSLL